MRPVFEVLLIGTVVFFYGSVGLVIGFAFGFVPLRLVQATASPPLLTDGVVLMVSLAVGCLFASLAGAGYLKTRHQQER